MSLFYTLNFTECLVDLRQRVFLWVSGAFTPGCASKTVPCQMKNCINFLFQTKESKCFFFAPETHLQTRNLEYPNAMRRSGSPLFVVISFFVVSVTNNN